MGAMVEPEKLRAGRDAPEKAAMPSTMRAVGRAADLRGCCR
jgi:hypothetical protein